MSRRRPTSDPGVESSRRASPGVVARLTGVPGLRVRSLDDARPVGATSGEPSLDGRERREWPERAPELIDETVG